MAKYIFRLKKNHPVFEGKYLDIRFIEKSATGKTNIFRVYSKMGDFLGQIRWFGRWRKYCFSTNAGQTVYFDKDCLKDITHFLEIVKSYAKLEDTTLEVKEDGKQ